MIKVLIVYLILINVSAFALYGIDKKKAMKDQYRISEKTLLLTAFIGGSLGALCGMFLFHHKTKHLKFRVCLPLFLMMHIILLYYCFKLGLIN